MGLDMYLYQRNQDKNEDDIQVGYWRKFNALHAYILDITDSARDTNCAEINLDLYEVEEILDTLKRVKNILESEGGFSVENIDRVGALMPPAAGFFWGSQDINEDYLNDINRSIDIFERARALLHDGQEIYYYCWW